MIQMCHQMSSNVIRCLIASLCMYMFTYLPIQRYVLIDLPYMLFALIILLSNYKVFAKLMSSPISVFSVHYLNEFKIFFLTPNYYSKRA